MPGSSKSNTASPSETKQNSMQDVLKPSYDDLSSEEVRGIVGRLETRLKGAEDALLSEQVCICELFSLI